MVLLYKHSHYYFLRRHHHLSSGRAKHRTDRENNPRSTEGSRLYWTLSLHPRNRFITPGSNRVSLERWKRWAYNWFIRCRWSTYRTLDILSTPLGGKSDYPVTHFNPKDGILGFCIRLLRRCDCLHFAILHPALLSRRPRNQCNNICH